MPITRKDRHGKPVIYGRVKLPSGKHREHRCTTWREAVAWEESVKVTQPDTVTGTVSLAALFTAYLDHVQARGMADKTYTEKRQAFRDLLADVKPSLPVQRVTYALIEAHLDGIARRISGAQANRRRKNILAAYSWGVRAFKLPEPCPWRVERYREDKRPKYVPTPEDFWKVHDAAKSPDERAMLFTALHTAARKEELFRMQRSDLDFANRRLRLWTRKRKGGGLEEDWIPMTQALHDCLLRHRLQMGFREHVFVSSRGTPWVSATHLMDSLCDKAGVRRFGFHAIRHLSASMLDGAGVPLSVIQAILRHRSALTTSRYLTSLRGVQASLDGVFDRTKSESPSEPCLAATHLVTHN